MKLKMNKKQSNWREAIMQLCLGATIISATLLFFKDIIISFDSLFLKTFFILIFGIGGCAIYVVVGLILREAEIKLKTSKKDLNSGKKKKDDRR